MFACSVVVCSPPYVNLFLHIWLAWCTVGACGSALQMGNLLHMAGQLGRAVESFHPELYEDDDDLSDGDIVDAAFRNHHLAAAGID